MQQLSAHLLEQEAKQRLTYARYNPRKLSVIHSGVSLAVTLILSVISYLLSRQIGSTGGLSGIGTRTVLMSVQYILQLAAAVCLPFWQIGFIYCAVQLARGKSPRPQDLTAGFRRIGGLLIFWLLQGLVYFCIAFVAFQVASMLISVTPMGQPLMEMMEQFMENPEMLESIMDSPAQLEALVQQLLPVYLIGGILFILVAIPVFYLLRMAPYHILEADRPSPIAAIIRSIKMMWRNLFGLLRIDLHFWWYYLLTILVAVLGYLDLLLPKLGVQLPIGANCAMLVTLAIHMVASLLMAWFFRSRVATVYACAYDTLIPKT